MNIAVIGLGSMGKRRIRLIHELYPEFRIIGIDGREDRREEAGEKLGIDCYDSIDSIDADKIHGDIDCAFVCTSPLSHASIITACINKGWHVFTELNLVSDGYDHNMSLAEEKGCTLFLSSTFLYREETRYIRGVIDNTGGWNYIYHIGQYLPDWHPWENYKDFFIGDKRTNGCREIMAIELPWLNDAFGEVREVKAVSDKITDLNIGFDDNFLITLTHENGNKGMLAVDIVSPVAVRKFEAFSEGRYVSWNGTPDSLTVFDPESGKAVPVSLTENAEHIEGYSSFIVENAYKNEIKEFFDVVLNGKEPIYGFKRDLSILHLIDEIGA